MRRLLWGLVATMCLWPFGSGSESQSAPRPGKAGIATNRVPDLTRAICPVLGETVSADHWTVVGGARVYFSTAEAQKEFLRHPGDYQALQRAQLVATGQLRQAVCALSGRPFQGYHWLTVAGVEVRVADAQLQQAARRRPQAELVREVFERKDFEKWFVARPIHGSSPVADPQLDFLEFARQIPETDDTDEARDAVLAQLANAMEAVNRNSNQLNPREGWIGLGASLTGGGRPVLVAILTRSDVGGLVPKTLDGLPVVRVVTGEFFGGGSGASSLVGLGGSKFTTGRVSRLERPVPIGVSTGADYTNASCTSGTIACRLVGTSESGSPVYYALGNNHIFGGLNLAPLDCEILQPGLADSGCVGPELNVIGRLSRRQLIQFGGLPNRIDAALASVTPATLSNTTPSDGYGTPKSMHIAPVVGLLTRKYGRSSGQTTGRIAVVNASIYVNYGTGSVLFTGQSLVSVRSPSTVIGQGGDSGSLMVTDPNNSPVGLLFSVNSAGSVALCNDLREVFKAFANLNLQIDGIN